MWQLMWEARPASLYEALRHGALVFRSPDPATRWKLSPCIVWSAAHLKQDDIEYAIENTQVILAPERQIATFGNTSFEFHLISELMDRVDQVRIRTGRIEAERPKILSPEYFCRMMLEGFGEKAQKYVDRLREQARQIAVLRYGFQFRKSGVTAETVHASLQSVIDRTRRAVESAGDPHGAIIQGVDEAWEVCLLKFTIEMIERSAGENIGDFKRRGLI